MYILIWSQIKDITIHDESERLHANHMELVSFIKNMEPVLHSWQMTTIKETKRLLSPPIVK